MGWSSVEDAQFHRKSLRECKRRYERKIESLEKTLNIYQMHVSALRAQNGTLRRLLKKVSNG